MVYEVFSQSIQHTAKGLPECGQAGILWEKFYISELSFAALRGSWRNPASRRQVSGIVHPLQYNSFKRGNRHLNVSFNSEALSGWLVRGVPKESQGYGTTIKIYLWLLGTPTVAPDNHRGFFGAKRKLFLLVSD